MVELKNVTKNYSSGTIALRNVSLSIGKGEFVFIVGSSGAGKSTLLKLIMCEEHPTRGEIFFEGASLASLKRKEIPYLRRKIGTVFQDFRLISSMSAYENVAFPLRVTGSSNRAIRKRVTYVMGLVGLASKVRCKPDELSGGEKQRVAFARAIANNPTLIIADEPTGNVDREMSYEMVELLNKINSCGVTVVMVTHEQDIVNYFGKRVITIENGEIISDIKPTGGQHEGERI